MSTTPAGAGPGSEDVEARFRSIIDAEFGPSPATGTPLPPQERPSRSSTGRTDPRPVGPEPFDMGRALDGAEPQEPDEPFVAPGAQPVPMPRGRALAGAVLLVGALVVLLAGIFGVRVPQPLGTAAVVAFVVGMGILLTCLPRTPRDPDDDGARV